MVISNNKELKTENNSGLSRRKRKLLKTRQNILNAATDLFSKHPYDDVKMEHISELADLSRATLYNHFNSKEAIYFEIGIQNFRSLHEKHKETIDSETLGFDKVIRLSEVTLRNLFEQPLLHEITRHYLFMNDQAEIPAHVTLKKLKEGKKIEDPTEILLARYLEELRNYEKVWVNAIERGFEDGSIQHELNADQLSHFIFMIISGIFDRVNLEKIMLKKSDLSAERIISLTVDLIRRDLEAV